MQFIPFSAKKPIIHTYKIDQLSSQVLRQSLPFTHLIPLQRQKTMQELLHGYEGVAGVITAFVACVIYAQLEHK